ncbi:MAG: flagellar basal-body rod protein FlgF [Pseudomonadota bacterium]
MENTLYIGMSREKSLRTSLDIISNNIVNATTTGYRAQNPLFEEYLDKQRGEKEALSFVMDYGQYDTTKPGTMQLTGGTFDVALSGPGFFGVQTPDGLRYTRAGNFTTNASGELTTASGHKVASSGGGSITIPQDAKDIAITDDGSISSSSGVLGRIMIQEFTDPQSLAPEGNGLYKTNESGTTATNTKAVQGTLEGSNVQPVLEMTRMIEISRDYQSIQRLITNEHERQRGAIERLGRVV